MQAQLCLLKVEKMLKDSPLLVLEKKLTFPRDIYGNPLNVQYDQIIFWLRDARHPENQIKLGDVVCSPFSYGYPDLMEIYGSLLVDSHVKNDVIGYLTPEEVATYVSKAMKKAMGSLWRHGLCDL